MDGERGDDGGRELYDDLGTWEIRMIRR